MRKTTYIINFINSRKELKNNNNSGFSLIELVVAVGILAILSVIGVVAYSQITKRAEQASVEAAASEIYTAVIAADSDGDSSTDPKKIAEDYQESFKDEDWEVIYRPATTKRTIGIQVTNFETGYNVIRGSKTI